MANESGKKHDFASLVARETETMTLTDPSTGKEIPGVSFEVYSKDTDHFNKIENQVRTKQQRRLRSSPRAGIDPGEMKQDEIRLLANCIVGWKGVEYKGVELPFSLQNAIMLLTEVPAVKEQIDFFVGDRTNFL